ncbi:hypothetical protein SAMN05428989_0589 [Pseudoxanthomonas sp. GM95]|uniref:hypothetical protein n=1 Tax=Pseudoxanthomonas sp. GM95 TaxID=1881043 RepID=UPI0008B2FE39|nr:hypothetical protein [Pseudoxanthomonas sp. GM95]SEK67792.1 hypothetical protein SAMN05428989_0589 [Pseudoxanthomonas sp. GM95]
MVKPQARYWFPAKQVGWGWGLPCGWQGWVVLGLYVVVLAVSGLAFPPRLHALALYGTVAAATLALILVCWRKGEPPRG